MYQGMLIIPKPRARETSVRVPANAGKTIHIVLSVTDDGTPSLTRYRRVVIECPRE